MTVWMLPAWNGWQMFIAKQKLPALLVAAVIYLLFAGKNKKLVYYGAVTTALCMIPGMAVLLMKYQTAFYDYPFIWSIVPVTALIALGGTQLLEHSWRRSAGFRGGVYNLVLTGLCILALFMSGSDKPEQDAEARIHAEAVLDEIWAELPPGQAKGEQICLWAPREILEYARIQGDRTGRGSFTLLYGRNMWDAALNAYTYDTYPEEMKQLYTWMEGLENAGTGQEEEAADDEVLRQNVEKAFSMGANCVLLPKHVAGAVPGTTERVQVVELEEYYLLMKV